MENNNPKQTQAKSLYFISDLTLQQIADVVGVHRKTLYTWITEGKWTRTRNTDNLTPKRVIQQYYTMLENYNITIFNRRDKYPDQEDAKIIRSIASTIKALTPKQPKNHYAAVICEFLTDFAKQDPDLYEQIKPYLIQFIASKDTSFPLRDFFTPNDCTTSNDQSPASISVPSSPSGQSPISVPVSLSCQSPISVPSSPSVQSPNSVPSSPSVQSPISVPSYLSCQSPISVPSSLSCQSPISVPSSLSCQSPISVPSSLSCQSPISVPSSLSFGESLSRFCGGSRGEATQIIDSPTSPDNRMSREEYKDIVKFLQQQRENNTEENDDPEIPTDEEMLKTWTQFSTKRHTAVAPSTCTPLSVPDVACGVSHTNNNINNNSLKSATVATSALPTPPSAPQSLTLSQENLPPEKCYVCYDGSILKC